MRIGLPCQPRSRNLSSRRGKSWRSLAATDALAASKDQLSSSIGPGRKCWARAAGNRSRIAAKRAFESCSRCRSRASGALRCRASAIGSESGTSGWGFEKGDFAFTPRSVAMQVLITHGNVARTRVYRFSRWQLFAGALIGLTTMLVLSATVYHLVFLKAAREGWPVVSQIVKLLVRDEFAQRDRFMRENLDAMAQKVGEMQAKMIKLEAMSERVSGMAGVKPEELQQLTDKPATAAAAGGKGGPFVPASSPSLEQLKGWVGWLDEQADQNTDVYTMVESRLLEKRLQS